MLVRVRLRGRDGIEVEARGPHVQTWRGGRLARYRLFQERADALAAVGLQAGPHRRHGGHPRIGQVMRNLAASRAEVPASETARTLIL